jgi:hypothetical protein
MAISIISYPLTDPVKITFSYPAIVVLQGSSYGAANVTQHRFRITISVDSVEVSELTTVVDDVTNKRGRFDLMEPVKSLIEQSIYAEDGSTPLTQITGVTGRPANPGAFKEIEVAFFEEYYLSGVWTSNAAAPFTYNAFRGWTDLISVPTYIWKYTNWNDFNGLRNFTPYTGKGYQVYPIRPSNSEYTDVGINQYMIVRINWLTDTGFPTSIDDFEFDRTDALKSEVVYINMIYGETILDECAGIEIRVYTNDISSIFGATLEETITIDKNVEVCENENETLMFRDRFFQWSFMHFPKISRTNIETESISGELPRTADVPGRFRYNVKARERIILNTDWMDEQQNPLIEDLIASESVWLVDQTDGSLEQVIITPSSIRLKTRRIDNLIQYSMSIVKSLNNFTA